MRRTGMRRTETTLATTDGGAPRKEYFEYIILN